MDNKKHLPIYGVGPIYVGVIVIITVAAVTLGQCEVFKKAQ